MLQPYRAHTWAPSGQTPVQRAWDRRDRLSAICALSLSPHHRHISLNHLLQRGNIPAPDVISFLKQLHNRLKNKLILVIDRYQVHRSAIRQLRDAGTRWLSVEWLPSYSPDLDPVEAVWAHTKCVDLANFVPDDIDELHHAVFNSLTEQAHDPVLKAAYFKWAGLRL